MALRVSSNTSLSLGEPGLQTCQKNVQKIGIALMVRANDFEGHFPKSISELVPRYLKSLPECPAAGRDTYSVGYQEGVSTPGNDYDWPDFFEVHCEGHHHADCNLGADLPLFNPATRLTPELIVERTPQQAREACQANLKNIGVALDIHYADHQGKYAESLEVLTPNYLYTIPKCPASRTDTYSSTFKSKNQDSSPASYSFSCSGTHPGAIPENGPAYDSVRGLHTP